MACPTSQVRPEVVAELCSSLEPALQCSLLEYAEFLKTKEVQRSLEVVDEEDEAEWDHQLLDPAKVGNFTRWADVGLAREKSRAIDPAQLRSHRAMPTFGGSITCCRSRRAPKPSRLIGFS
jgi:hypothetical protein